MSILNGDVGEVRSCSSLSRYGFGIVVVWGGQRVLSLSRIRAFILGIFLSVLDSTVVVDEARCWPICSGRSRKVGIVRLGRKWDGCLSKVETVRLKAWRFVFSKGAIVLAICS